MPVPKRKLSRARIRSRQANKHLEPKVFMECKNCQAPTMPHIVCESCGFYKGRKILETKMDRALKRGQSRQAMQQKMEAHAQSANANKEQK
jgi:large subunit ribosomal protein L32